MWFKNLSLYRLPDDYALDQEALEGALAKQRQRDCGPLEWVSHGFCSPYGREHEQLVHEASDAQLVCLGSQEKLLPGSVVREALQDKVEAETERLGRAPGKRQREQLKDEVLTDLLPRAFVKPNRLYAYIDRKAKLLVVDSASAKGCDALLEALREGIGSFAVTPLDTNQSIPVLLSAWVASAAPPTGFALGDECEMRDPADTTSVARFRNHDLTAEEVREHVNLGRQVTQLGLVYDGRLTIVVDDKLKLRKLRFLDLVQEQLDQGSSDDARSELDASFILMVLELRKLFAQMGEALSWS